MMRTLNPILRAQQSYIQAGRERDKGVRPLTFPHMRSASVLGCYVLLEILSGTYKRKRPVHLKLGGHKVVQKMRKMLMLFEALSRSAVVGIDTKVCKPERTARDMQHAGGNMHLPQRRCSSKFRGLCWHKGVGKWAVQLRINNQNQPLGYFADELQAARVYDHFVILTRPADAPTNFERPPKGKAYTLSQLAGSPKVQAKLERILSRHVRSWKERCVEVKDLDMIECHIEGVGSVELHGDLAQATALQKPERPSNRPEFNTHTTLPRQRPRKPGHILKEASSETNSKLTRFGLAHSKGSEQQAKRTGRSSSATQEKNPTQLLHGPLPCDQQQSLQTTLSSLPVSQERTLKKRSSCPPSSEQFAMHTGIVPFGLSKQCPGQSGEGAKGRQGLVNSMSVSIRRSQRRKSTFKGVKFDADSNQWMAELRYHGKTQSLGRFATEEEAAKAYDAAGRMLDGPAFPSNFQKQTGLGTSSVVDQNHTTDHGLAYSTIPPPLPRWGRVGRAGSNKGFRHSGFDPGIKRKPDPQIGGPPLKRQRKHLSEQVGRKQDSSHELEASILGQTREKPHYCGAALMSNLTASRPVNRMLVSLQFRYFEADLDDINDGRATSQTLQHNRPYGALGSIVTDADASPFRPQLPTYSRPQKPAVTSQIGGFYILEGASKQTHLASSDRVTQSLIRAALQRPENAHVLAEGLGHRAPPDYLYTLPADVQSIVVPAGDTPSTILSRDEIALILSVIGLSLAENNHDHTLRLNLEPERARICNSQQPYFCLNSFPARPPIADARQPSNGTRSLPSELHMSSQPTNQYQSSCRMTTYPASLHPPLSVPIPCPGSRPPDVPSYSAQMVYASLGHGQV